MTWWQETKREKHTCWSGANRKVSSNSLMHSWRDTDVWKKRKTSSVLHWGNSVVSKEINRRVQMNGTVALPGTNCWMPRERERRRVRYAANRIHFMTLKEGATVAIGSVHATTVRLQTRPFQFDPHAAPLSARPPRIHYQCSVLQSSAVSFWEPPG